MLTIASSFAILLAFRFAQVVWLQGGATSSWEAVINTVPGDRRDRMRAFLYGGPTQVGTVLAGIVTLVGERAVSPRVLYGLGLAAAAGATYSMVRVRRAYAAELVVALREGRPHVFGGTPGAGEPFGLARADRAAVEVAVGAMADPDAGVRRVAAELLGGPDTPDATAALIRGVHDDDPEVRATALRSLARSEAFAASEASPSGSRDPVPEVRLAALEALGALRADRSRARALLADPDGLVRAQAAAILLEDAPTERTAGSRQGRPEAEAALARLTRSPLRGDAGRGVPRARQLEATRDARTSPGRASRPGAVRPRGGGAHDDRAGSGRRRRRAHRRGRRRGRRPGGRGRGDEPLAGPFAATSSGALAETSATDALESRRLADSIEADGDEKLDAAPRLPPRGFPGHGLRRDPSGGRSSRERGAISTALESLWGDDPAQRANALEVIETIGDHDLVRPLLALFEEGRLQRHRSRLARPGVLHHPDDWIRTAPHGPRERRRRRQPKPARSPRRPVKEER